MPSMTMYGTKFEELSDDEKTAVSKRPKGVQDEIVTDEKGRRRFHGAFTGGFSAGYFNTPGSKHGWVPQTFKSSREQRFKTEHSKAEDYMDSEDFGEFGIAAKKIRMKTDFMQSLALPGEKMQLAWERSGTTTSSASKVDGSDLSSRLAEFLKPVNNSVGTNLLKKMGWRPGKGIGPKMSKRLLEKQRVREALIDGKSTEFDEEAVKEVEELSKVNELSPEDIPLRNFKSKENLHGLGYSGLGETNILSESYGKATATLKTRKQSKGIRGQAFGVGVYEEDDEDIYTNFDLNQYDFEIGATTSQITNVPKFDSTFVPASKNLNIWKFFIAPNPPRDFRPRHKPKPIELKKEVPQNLIDAQEKLTPLQRALFLGFKDNKVMDLLSDKDREFLKAVKQETDSREKYSRDSREKTNYEPFEEEPIKAHRFKKFVHYLKRGIPFPQPVELTRLEWEKELEEFQNVLPSELRSLLPEVRSRLKPLVNADFAKPIAENFRSKFQKESDTQLPTSSNDSKQVQIDAVSMKNFGALTRKKYEWHPVKELCKRFNVPNPYPESHLVGALGLPKKTRTNAEYSLFDLGMPTTSQELSTRQRESRFDVKSENLPTVPDSAQISANSDVPKPQINVPAPIDFLKALFEESEEEESSDDEIIKQPEVIYEKQKTEEKPPIEACFVEKPPPRREKLVTILDIVDDDEYGPAPPPNGPLDLSTVDTIRIRKRECTVSLSSSDSEERRKSKRHKKSKKKRHKHEKKKH